MKKIMENWRKQIDERAVNVSSIWRKLHPKLHEKISQFMEDYVANQNEIEGLEEVDLDSLVDAMAKAATSEVANYLTNREAGAVKARESDRWRNLEDSEE